MFRTSRKRLRFAASVPLALLYAISGAAASHAEQLPDATAGVQQISPAVVPVSGGGAGVNSGPVSSDQSPGSRGADSGLSAESSAPSWCGSSTWMGFRDEVCVRSDTFLNWYDQNGKQTGRADLRVTQHLQLNPKGRTFAENFDLEVTRVTGTLPGASLNLNVSCGGTCVATSHFPNGSAIVAGSTVSAAISYEDSTSAVNKTYSAYSLSWGPQTKTPIDWTSPYYRCDNVFAGYSPGCVFPDIFPVLTSMSSLPNISANIRNIQQSGPSHYGRMADGLPISRNSSLEAANRRISCPPDRPRPAGMSCDEYPFATTDQGASKTSQPDWGWAWVPVEEQNSQGGLLSSFYRSSRVMDGTNGNGDKFWVQV